MFVNPKISHMIEYFPYFTYMNSLVVLLCADEQSSISRDLFIRTHLLCSYVIKQKVMDVKFWTP